MAYTDPANAGTFSGGAVQQGWAQTLQPYLKSTQLFQCPSETTPAANVNTSDAAFGGVGYSDYWYNSLLAGSPDGVKGGSGISQAAVASVAQTIMSGDGGVGGSGPTLVNPPSAARRRIKQRRERFAVCFQFGGRQFGDHSQ